MTDAEEWYKKGLALGNSNSPTKQQDSLDAFEKALSLDPKFVMAWNYKGLALANLGRYEEAVDAFNNLLLIDPKFVMAWYYYGLTLYQLGKYQDSLDAYDKALSLEPKFESAWCDKATTLYQLGKYQDSLDACEKALSLDPKDEVAWNNKGGALAKLDRHQEAVLAFDKALSIKPYYVKALNNKSDSLTKLGRHQDASRAYEKAKICKNCHGKLQTWYMNHIDLKDSQKTKEPTKICVGNVCTQCNFVIPDFAMFVQVFKTFELQYGKSILNFLPLIESLILNDYILPEELYNIFAPHIKDVLFEQYDKETQGKYSKSFTKSHFKVIYYYQDERVIWRLVPW